KVVGLVYVAAFQPDSAETTFQWIQSAPPAPENGILPPDDKGFVYYDKEKYHAGFCADISKEEADFMCASQGATSLQCFIAPITHAAWRDKPAYGLIATEDKSINPDIQRAMYKRSNTKTAEVVGSHVIFMSKPEEVADMVIKASVEVAG